MSVVNNQKPSFLKHFIGAFISTVFIGTLFSRALGWQDLESDVGLSGAVIVVIFFHVIYAVFILAGVLVNRILLTCRNRQVDIKTIYFSSAITIIYFDLIMYFFSLKEFFIIIIILFVLSLFISFIYSLKDYLN